MPIRYKLTNQDLTTYNGFQWELNQWKESSGIGPLCYSGWLHCYSNPLLAILLNPIHANIINPKLFEVDVEGKSLDDNGIKEGWTRMKLVKELDVPNITLIQKVAFGILCSLEVCKNESYVKWANNWLNNIDRSEQSAAYAAYAAYYSANAAKSANSAYYSTNSSANVDYYSANSANIANTAANSTTNLIELAEKAMKIQ